MTYVGMVAANILKLSDVRDCRNGTAVTIQMDRLCQGETEEY
jgi:hypothetical protein